MKQLLIATATLVLLAACAHTPAGPMAMATLQPTPGSTAQGTVHFQELRNGSVEVQVDLAGVPPGVHGFHIHEKGDCGDNGNAAGGHFNPTGAPHAGPDTDTRHAGDFGNVTADANGIARTTFRTRSITVRDGSISVVGRAVMLHANPDDLTTQPTGNAGGRIACGVAHAHAVAGSMQP